MRAQYYDATVSRFITEDPIHSYNLFLYGDNNPLSKIDYTGESPLHVAMGIGLLLVEMGVIDIGFALYANTSDQFTQLEKDTATAGAIAAFTTPGALYGPVATGGLRFSNSNKVFKPFTRSYYRHNLQVFTGVAGEGMHAHHILPQATRFQKYWKNVGININNPINMKWWEAGDHVSNSYDYNKAWDEFFELNSNPTKKQIINFGSNLMKDFGF